MRLKKPRIEYGKRNIKTPKMYRDYLMEAHKREPLLYGVFVRSPLTMGELKKVGQKVSQVG